MIIKTKIVISSNPNNLKNYLKNFKKSGTVEAEYGDVTVFGSVISLAHHGLNSNNPPPCEYNSQDFDLDCIGVSHIDLDTLGGIMAISGKKYLPEEFWKTSGEIDVKGIHKVKIDPYFEIYFNAFYAFSEKHRIFAPRDGSVLDITEQVMEFIDFFKQMSEYLNGFHKEDNIKLINEGIIWKTKLEDLKKASFVKSDGIITLRKSNSFVNFYTKEREIVIAYNTLRKSITISKSDDDIALDCAKVMKEIFGEEAGGRSNIAGTPRNLKYEEGDALKVFEEIKEKISKNSTLEDLK